MGVVVKSLERLKARTECTKTGEKQRIMFRVKLVKEKAAKIILAAGSLKCVLLYEQHISVNIFYIYSAVNIFLYNEN